MSAKKLQWSRASEGRSVIGVRGPRTVAGATKVLLLFGALAGICLFASPAHAEGSKDLTSQGGDRAFLWYRTSGGLHDFGGIPAQSAIRAYVQPGERLLLGSSAAGIGNGTINFTRPDGSTGTCGNSGRIDDRAEEVAGPLPTSGGYNPCSITVGAAEGGVWQIRFISPASGSGGIPTGQSAASNWTQSTGVSWIAAWDVTVRNAANTASIPGRVYANYLSFSMGTGFGVGSTGRSFTPEVFVQTGDGYRFRYDYNGLDPLTFLTFANNKGFRDSGGVPLFRSVQLTTGDQFQNGESIKNPGTADTTADVTHKLFFTVPAADLPTSAAMAGGSTWLANPPATPPTVTNLTFTGSEGTQNQAAYGQGGEFEFDTAANTSYRLIMDINSDGTFGNANDRTFIGYTQSGQSQVTWDGKDGNGTFVAPGSTGIETEVTVYTGEVHFPLLDPENNPDGAVIQRVIPSSDYTVFYDDTGLTGGTPPSPVRVLNGESSLAGSHEWSGLYGDHKGVDTWAYGNSRTLAIENAIEVKSADLSVTNSDNQTSTAAGSPITYTVLVTNNGPSSVTSADFDDVVPAGVSNVSWTCEITSGVGVCGTSTGTGNVVTSALDLNAGAVATFTISGTVADSAPVSLSNTATITRPADVSDPDTTNNSATDTTTVNRRPVATDKIYATDEDQTLSVLAPGLLLNASDPDGDALTSELVTGPAQGIVNVGAGGSFTYVPDANFYGDDTFTYKVCDNGTPVSCSDVKTVTITVTPVNDPPVAQNDSKSTDEDQVLSFPASDLVANDDPGPENESAQNLTVTGVANPSHGTVELASGLVTFTPDPNYYGPASFTYTVSDGNGGSASATVNITVRPINDAPDARDDDRTTAEDTPITIDVLANDVDTENQSLIAGDISTPQNGTASLVTTGPDAGRIRYTPNSDFNGSDSFTYKANDGNGGSDTATVTITVTPVNDAPVARDDNYSTVEDVRLDADGTGSNPPGVLSNDDDTEDAAVVLADAQPDVPGFQPVSGPDHGSLNLNANGTFAYTPNADFVGQDTFTYRACDSGGTCDTATVTITVVPDRAPPQLQDDFGSTGEAAAVSNAYVSQYPSSKPTASTRLFQIDASQKPYRFVKKGKDIKRPFNALGYRSTNRSLYGYRLKKSPGIIKINPKTGAAKFLGNPRGLPASSRYFAGDVSPNGSTYYLYKFKASELWKVDLKRFKATRVKLSSSTDVPDLAASPIDGRLYGVSSTGKLIRIDPKTGKVKSSSVPGLTPGTYGATWFTVEGDLIAYKNGSARVLGTLTWIASPLRSPEVVSMQSGPSTRGNDGAAYVRPPKLSGLKVQVDVLANDEASEGALDSETLEIVQAPAHGTVVVNPDKTVTYTSGATYSNEDSFQYQVCDDGSFPLCATATVYITFAPESP